MSDVPAKHLVMFDVDGTLVRSLEAEALLYPRACEQALGIREVSCEWETYRCPSDRGIVSELVQRNYGREATSGDYSRVERKFLTLIQDAYAERPEFCRPTPGALEAFRHISQLPSVIVCIATAGWRSTALYKLASSGFEVKDLALATSHDAEEKADIMAIASERARALSGVHRFASIVSIGDSAGDARASAQLGYGFIAIDTSGFLPTAKHRYQDFSDLTSFVSTLRVLQGKRS